MNNYITKHCEKCTRCKTVQKMGGLVGRCDLGIEDLMYDDECDQIELIPNAGYIYILYAKEIPYLVKIGRTNKNVKERTSSINSETSCIYNLNTYQSFIVDNVVATELHIHKALQDFRVRKNREFFYLKPAIAEKYISNIISKQYSSIKDNTHRNISELATVVKKGRGKLGLTQSELSKEAKVGLRFIRDLEQRKKTTLRMDKVLDVCNFLGIQINVSI